MFPWSVSKVSGGMGCEKNEERERGTVDMEIWAWLNFRCGPLFLSTKGNYFLFWAGRCKQNVQFVGHVPEGKR